MTVQEIQTMIRQNMVLYRNVAKPLTDKEADLLIATWADALSDVPSAAGKLAFRRALRVCHFPVLIADLYDQLRAMQMESEPKAVGLRKSAQGQRKQRPVQLHRASSRRQNTGAGGTRCKQEAVR